MRILVMSDTHGSAAVIRFAINAEKNFQMLIHLGDGANDLSAVLPLLEGRPYVQVRGNCDLGASDVPELAITQEGGKTLFCTHGHRQFVKYGEQTLIDEARRAHADIALYGHTHVPVQHYEDGLYVCNPGSLRDGHYAVLEIVPQGIMWLPRKL